MDFCILYAKIIKIKKNKRLEIIQLMCNEARIYDFFCVFNDITENNELFHNILMHRDGAVYMHLSICLSINIIYNRT